MDAQNLSNEFQAGEFAKSPLVSPVATLGAALGNQLPIDDYLLSDAVESFLALELVNTDSMTINSYFHVFGLGKTDLSQYSDYYQAIINQGAATAGNDSVTNSEQDAIDAKRWRYFRDVVLLEQGFAANPFDFQNAIDDSMSKAGA